jgi:hypothetical protein
MTDEELQAIIDAGPGLKASLEARLEASPGERVTPEYIKSRIAAVKYFSPEGTVTMCSLTLDNGYSVRGESACVDPANYDGAIGRKLAYDKAFDALWPLFGFLLAEKRHLARQG